MTKDELVAALADIEHQRWSEWQAWVHECGTILPDGALLLDADHIGRWARQMGTPYAELSEEEQASDIEQVMRYWSLIVGFVAEWLSANAGGTGWERKQIADAWREEMA